MNQINAQIPFTYYSDPETLVLQIIPDLKSGQISVHEKSAYRIDSYVFIPQLPRGTTSCPLNYFQESVSLPGKWILDDNQKRINLIGLDNLKRVLITKKSKGVETVINLPYEYGVRIFQFFLFDIVHNVNKYLYFDCYAFASLVSNIRYSPQAPEFEYLAKQPIPGDIVVLANDTLLPNAIKHWALYLGDNLYISKFGESRVGSDCLVSVTDLDAMKKLYDCAYMYVAKPIDNASPWNGYHPKAVERS